MNEVFGKPGDFDPLAGLSPSLVARLEKLIGQSELKISRACSEARRPDETSGPVAVRRVMVSSRANADYRTQDRPRDPLALPGQTQNR